MKAQTEKSGAGVFLFAETQEERRQLLNLWLGWARCVAMEGVGDRLFIAPIRKNEGFSAAPSLPFLKAEGLKG